MKIAEQHAEFLAKFAWELGHFYEAPITEIERASEFIEWFAKVVFEHGYKHGAEKPGSNDPSGGATKPYDPVTLDNKPLDTPSPLEDGEITMNMKQVIGAV